MRHLSSLSISIGGLAALAASACATVYTSVRPHTATVGDTSVTADRVIAVDGPRKQPESLDVPVEGVYVHAEYRTDPKVAVALPTLAHSSSAPCSGGVPAIGVAMDRSPPAPGDTASSGRVLWGFPRASIETEGLLHAATVLDVPVAHLDGRPPECLRVPIVDNHGDVEWERKPNFSIGYGFEMLVPFRKIYGVSATSLFALRFGPWVGPVRLQAEFNIGGAIAKANNPNLVGFAYGGGIRADTLLFAARRFGLSAAAGYDVTAIRFGTDVNWYSSQGSGYQGAIHGPRAGVRFALLGEPAPGPAFRRRRDSESASFEIYAAPQWSHDHPSATPALWLMLNIDGGF